MSIKSHPVPVHNHPAFSHHSWIAEAFQKYHLQQSTANTGDAAAHLRPIESRFLGTATLQLGAKCFPHASFYEITESEISEQGLERKHARSSSTTTQDITPPFQDQQLDDHDHHVLTDGGSKLSTDCCSASEVSCGRPDCAYLSLSESIAAATLLEKYAADDDNTLHNKSTVALPPKKRKRRRIIRQDIAFTFVPHEEDDFLPDADYYCFPKDALAEPLTDEPPYEVKKQQNYTLFVCSMILPLLCIYNISFLFLLDCGVLSVIQNHAL
jgi:hypothetical protein